MSVRIYGPVVGHGSYCRVASGMRHGLEVLGEFAGLVPIDAYDAEENYGGADAEVGVYVGPAGGVVTMKQLGVHKEHLVLLPPNSTCVPADLLRFLEKEVTGLIAPSKWGVGILNGLVRWTTQTSLRTIELWHHGVDECFCRSEAEELVLDADYVAGEFRVLHMASTVAQRKGTKELILGWIEAANAGALGARPSLEIVVDGPSGSFLDVIEAAADGEPQNIDLLPRGNLSVAAMAQHYRKFHVVAAPSRGEGFGLIPLEARACGVPVMATAFCTGHADHMVQETPGFDCLAPGVIDVHTGGLEPIDDGPDALGPSLRPQSVADALERAYHGWAGYAADARAHAKHLMERWSWVEVTKRWLESRR